MLKGQPLPYPASAPAQTSQGSSESSLGLVNVCTQWDDYGNCTSGGASGQNSAAFPNATPQPVQLGGPTDNSVAKVGEYRFEQIANNCQTDGGGADSMASCMQNSIATWQGGNFDGSDQERVNQYLNAQNAPAPNTPISAGTYVPELGCFVDKTGTCMLNDWEVGSDFGSPSNAAQQQAQDYSGSGLQPVGGASNLYYGGQQPGDLTPAPDTAGGGGIVDFFRNLFGGGSSQQSVPPPAPPAPPANNSGATMYTDNTGAIYSDTGAPVGQDSSWGVNPRNDIGTTDYTVSDTQTTFTQPESTSVFDVIGSWWDSFWGGPSSYTGPAQQYSMAAPVLNLVPWQSQTAGAMGAFSRWSGQ